MLLLIDRTEPTFLVRMAIKQFFFLGEETPTTQEIEVDAEQDVEALKRLVASYFAIVEPSGKSCAFVE